MQHKLVRVSFEDFLDQFVPGEDPGDASFSGLFDKVPVRSGEVPVGSGEVPVKIVEADMYGPLLDAINKGDILQGFTVVATDALPDTNDSSRQKIDGGMYPADSAPTTNSRTDWSTIELSIECKVGDQDDPFDDSTPTRHPFSDKRRAILGQILSYAVLVFEYQHRTHHYTIIIFDKFARIVRWDRSGAIFSEKFNYIEEPAKLARFLYRFSRLSPVQRGHDPTATRVFPETPDYELMESYASTPRLINDYARKIFQKTLTKDRPWWRITVKDAHGPRDFLVGTPTFVASGLVGRGTRGYVALDLNNPDHPFVFLKDCWRVLHERSEPEGAILSYLNECGVEGIPSRLCDGDVDGQETISQDVWKAEHVGETCRMKHHKHYRLVVKEVGIPLHEFENGQQLLFMFIDCIEAHESAYLKAGVIHRDISSGNLLMLPEEQPDANGNTVYKGLLTDWELSKRMEYDSKAPRHPDRTGTWQFMSVNALNNPDKPISIPDELESFFHALLWFAIRWLPHNCNNVGKFMFEYFDTGSTENDKEYTCGAVKEYAMDSSKGLRTNASTALRFLRHAPPKQTSEGPSAHLSTSSNPSNPGEALVSAVKAPEWPKEDLHPIDGVFAEILDWLHAAYQLANHRELEPTKVPTRQPRNINEDRAARFKKFQHRLANSQRKGVVREPAQQLSRAQLEARAKNLESHTVMVEFLYALALDPDIEWPQEDKQPDQLSRKFKPGKETKVAEDKATTGSKRKALPEGVSSDSAPKRPR